MAPAPGEARRGEARRGGALTGQTRRRPARRVRLSMLELATGLLAATAGAVAAASDYTEALNAPLALAGWAAWLLLT